MRSKPTIRRKDPNPMISYYESDANKISLVFITDKQDFVFDLTKESFQALEKQVNDFWEKLSKVRV